MNKEKRKTLIVSILGLIISLVGVSYAFFRASVMGSESNSTIYGVAANLTIEFREGTSQISASDIFPGWSETKTFYIKNNNSAEGEYSLKIFDVENGFMEDSISFEITSTNDGASIEKRNLPASDEVLEPGIVIAGNTTQEYTVKVYYNNLDIDQSADLGKRFTFKIGIDEAIKEPAPENWYKSKKGTLLAGIKANYKTATAPLTTPGVEASTSDEAVMAANEDDYGTSYYFRGNVQNNYVVFANMCWRIVRVTGDGSIKLTLYNYSSTDCTETGDNLAFARYSGTTYKTAFNTNKDSNAYLGFMYGSPTGSTYGATHANTTKSIILTNLETWYENNIATYESKLADTIWCNDKSTYNTSTGIGTSISYYGANNRYVSGIPSLICPNDNDGGKLSKFTVSDTTNGNGALDKKIGLLTYDEMVFSGLKLGTSNPNYLTANTGSSWWLMSPAILQCGSSSITYFDEGPSKYSFLASGGCWANMFFYNQRDSGLSYLDAYVSSNLALRPSLALKSTTTISTGNGTASSPFTVN